MDNLKLVYITVTYLYTKDVSYSTEIELSRIPNVVGVQDGVILIHASTKDIPEFQNFIDKLQNDINTILMSDKAYKDKEAPIAQLDRVQAS
jgi:hypothetical protein